MDKLLDRVDINNDGHVEFGELASALVDWRQVRQGITIHNLGSGFWVCTERNVKLRLVERCSLCCRHCHASDCRVERRYMQSLLRPLTWRK